MGLINPILVNSTNANDATAIGGSAGSCVYQINTTTNRVDTFIYYQAKDVASAAIVAGSVLEPADASFTTATGKRSGGSAFTGTGSGAGTIHFFLGIGMATMTANYYGYAQRTGRNTTVNTETATIAAGDILIVDGSTDLEAKVWYSTIDSTSAATLKSSIGNNLQSILGYCTTTETAGTPDSTVVVLCPILNLVGG